MLAHVRASLQSVMGDCLTREQQIQREVQEIYDVLRREQPNRSMVSLWSEALSLWSVRLETEVLLPPDEDEC